MVDVQLDQFEEQLRKELSFQLSVHTPMNEWEQFDRLECTSWENINATVRDVFAPFIRQYAYTPAVEILQNCRNVLIHIVWSSMNVPFPRNPFLHIERVIDNTLNMYFRTTYACLRTEMIMANHYAALIQRNWKSATCNPSYTMCRRRLRREYEELKNIFAQH